MIVLGEQFGNSLGRYCDLDADYLVLMIDDIFHDFAFYIVILQVEGIMERILIIVHLAPASSIYLFPVEDPFVHKIHPR